MYETPQDVAITNTRAYPAEYTENISFTLSSCVARFSAGFFVVAMRKIFFFGSYLSHTQVNLLHECIRVSTINYTKLRISSHGCVGSKGLRLTFDTNFSPLGGRKNCLIEFDFEVGNMYFKQWKLFSISTTSIHFVFWGNWRPAYTGKIVNAKQMRRR